MEKKCFKCNDIKPIDGFYKHSKMSDGHVNKCKECCKLESNERHNRLIQNEEFVLSERERSKERYHRLNYKENQKKYRTYKPYRIDGRFANVNRKMKVCKGFENHHWNYDCDYLYDVITLTVSEHRKIHRHLVLDNDLKLFRTKDNEILDTKEKHISFIQTFIKRELK